jgi:hypothetical protein
MALDYEEEINLDGMRKLLIGMIKTALWDIRKKEIGSFKYKSALNWLSYNGDNGEYPIPFEDVCVSLGFEPSYFRKRVYDEPKIREKLSKQGVLEELLDKNKMSETALL